MNPSGFSDLNPYCLQSRLPKKEPTTKIVLCEKNINLYSSDTAALIVNATF